MNVSEEDRSSPRVAIVTGAAVGLGRSIAQRLATSTSGLVLADRDGDELERTAEMLMPAGIPVRRCVADVRDADFPARVIEDAAQLGGADILINNAGIVPYAPFFETTPEFLREILVVDVESVYFMTQAFAASLIERGVGGTVVNLGTSHALAGVGGTSAYAAGKGAVHAMTRALAVELAPHGIRVNTLALGTTMTDRVVRNIDADVLRGRMAQIPLERGADPTEAADAVAFLVEAGYATGTELVLDGGFTIFGDR